MMKIALDAGHGRNTAGKRTPAGEREWTFNDTVVKAIIAELKNYSNVSIIRVDDPTGNTDVPLTTRANKANNFGADVYVSVHHNANTGKWGTWTGTETFVMAGSSQSSGAMKLAKSVHPKLVKAMGLRDRGIKSANFAVLRQTKMPAILTEGGYMDSTIDIVKMRNSAVLKNAGIAIAQGVAAYGGLKRVSGSTPKPATPAPSPTVKPATKPSNSLYRVRKTWEDASTQLGAFAELDGAKALVDANLAYKVFDAKGKVVYDAKALKLEKIAEAEKAEKANIPSPRFAKYVALAKEYGFTDGSRPKDYATREEVMTMLVRILEKEDINK